MAWRESEQHVRWDSNGRGSREGSQHGTAGSGNWAKNPILALVKDKLADILAAAAFLSK